MVFYKRQRKAIAPFILAFWIFALFVSIAHACGLNEDLSSAGQSEAAMVGAHDGSEDCASPACAKFCSDDFPLLAKLKAIQDPPAGQGLMVPTFVGESFQTVVGPVPSLLPSPGHPPGIAVNIRFVRVAL